MNNFVKNKLKSYSFWVSLASAILLLVQTIGRPLGLVIDESTYMSIVNSVLGVFVVLGIISHPAQNLLKNNQSVDCNEGNYSETLTAQNTKNGDLTSKNVDIHAKNGGLVIDSKSDSNACQVNVDAYENNDLDLNSRQRIEKAKRDFIDSYN